MNSKQRTVLIVAAAIVTAMLLFPPFHFLIGVDAPLRETNFGYSFILRPPVLAQSRGADDYAVIANVNWALLLTQWVGVTVAAVMLWFASRD
jgi:hypothetical protein